MIEQLDQKRQELFGNYQKQLSEINKVENTLGMMKENLVKLVGRIEQINELIDEAESSKEASQE